MEEIKKFLKKTSSTSIIESIIFVIIGLIIVWKPEGTIKLISIILGISFIIIGIYKVMRYFSTKEKDNFYNYNLIYGIMACIIGIIIMAFSSTISSIIRIVIGVWIIYSSLMRMNLSIKLKSSDSNIWIYSLVLSFIMFICGVYIIVNSGAVIFTIGIMMIIYAIIDIIENVIFIKNIK